MHLFLFDIDGTLLKGSTAVHRDAFAHAFRAVYGLPLSLDGISAAGRTDTWLLMEPLRQVGVPDGRITALMPDAFAEMERYAETHLGDLRDRVLPGVPELLSALDRQDVLLGLLTGNLEGIAKAKMRAAGLDRYFDFGAFGSESAVRDDLVPVALRAAEARAGHAIPRSSAVVIGDTPLDVAAGKAHGTHAVGVATGPYSVDELRAGGADLTVATLAEPGVAQALLQLRSRLDDAQR